MRDKKSRTIPDSRGAARQRNCSVFCRAAAASLLFALTAVSANSDDREIVVVYFEQARLLYQSGKPERAKQLLSTSLEFFPTYSESLFLMAKILSSDATGSTSRQSTWYLAQAIHNDSWQETDPLLVRVEYAKALFRMGQFQEAHAVIEGLSDLTPRDPGPLLLLAKIERLQGNLSRSLSLLEAGLKRFPDTEEFYLLASELLEQTGRTAEALQVVRTGLMGDPQAAGLLLRAAELTENGPDCLALINKYLRLGGRDPKSCILALERGAKDYERFVMLFVDFGGLQFPGLLERMHELLLPSAVPEAFERAMGDYTGDRTIDVDRNGYYEQRSVYREGSLRGWRWDHDQDGVDDFQVDFNDGVPQLLSVRDSEESSTRYVFGEYPHLATVEFNQGGSKRMYYLVPSRLRFDFMKTPRRPSAFFPTIVLPLRLPAEEQVADSSCRMEYHAVGGDVVRVLDLLDGQTVFLGEDIIGDGQLDHLVYYSAGLPVHGLRDLDGDGSFEVRELYLAGSLVQNAYYTDGSDKPYLVEQYMPGPERYWDCTDDGVFDIKEYQGGKNITVREYSTRFDGVLDLRVIYDVGNALAVVEEELKHK